MDSSDTILPGGKSMKELYEKLSSVALQDWAQAV